MRQDTKDFLINIVSLVSLIITFVRLVLTPNLESVSLALASLATVITLYVGKKKIERVEKKHVILPKKLFSISVALWGPTGSGKSWLCNALGRSLELYYNKEVEGLIYRIEKVSQKNFANLSQYDIEPTRGIEDYSFKFERSRVLDKYSHSISSFQHTINIIDMPGKMSLDAPYIQSTETKTLGLLSLIEADVVLVALDPTAVKGSPAVTDYEPKWNGNQYAELVSALINTLEEASENKKYYAICITKSDIIPSFYTFSPKALVATIFGPEMVKLINNFPDKKRLGIFSVSSVGFTTKLIPNYNYERDGLLDSVNWTPYGVEYPFFEAFEYSEKKYLEEKFDERWITRITKYSRLKKYISYPKSHYELPYIIQELN